MSIRVMSRVWDDGPDEKAELLVLLSIADFCNDAGECWPAVSSIARKSRMSERGVQKILQRLCGTGWIEIDAGGGRRNCNLYRVKTPNTVHPRTTFTPNAVTETPNTVPKNPEPRSPEPSLTVIEPSVRIRAREILASLLGEKVADDFIAHRKGIKKPLTDRAAELIVERLAGCRDPVAVVNQSIMNGWQGVFPEKLGGNKDGAAADRARRAGERYAERCAARNLDSGADRNPSQPLLPAR